MNLEPRFVRDGRRRGILRLRHRHHHVDQSHHDIHTAHGTIEAPEPPPSTMIHQQQNKRAAQKGTPTFEKSTNSTELSVASHEL